MPIPPLTILDKVHGYTLSSRIVASMHEIATQGDPPAPSAAAGPKPRSRIKSMQNELDDYNCGRNTIDLIRSHFFGVGVQSVRTGTSDSHKRVSNAQCRNGLGKGGFDGLNDFTLNHGLLQL